MKKAIWFMTALAGGLLWMAGPGVGADNGEPKQRDFSHPPRKAVMGRKITGSRAYLYSPPPIPHSVRDELRSDYCLECHAKEYRIEKRHQPIAPVPHEEFSQCVQCHVKGSERNHIEPLVENAFVGLDFPGSGMAAGPFAPPTIPHKIFMRENCLACHGETGDAPIRSPHPQRSQCQQCHAAEAPQDFTRPVDWEQLRGKP